MENRHKANGAQKCEAFTHYLKGSLHPRKDNRHRQMGSRHLLGRSRCRPCCSSWSAAVLHWTWASCRWQPGYGMVGAASNWSVHIVTRTLNVLTCGCENCINSCHTDCLPTSLHSSTLNQRTHTIVHTYTHAPLLCASPAGAPPVSPPPHHPPTTTCSGIYFALSASMHVSGMNLPSHPCL